MKNPDGMLTANGCTIKFSATHAGDERDACIVVVKNNRGFAVTDGPRSSANQSRAQPCHQALDFASQLQLFMFVPMNQVPEDGDSQLNTLGLLEQLLTECKTLWGTSSTLYSRIDELLRELANPNLHDIPIRLPFRVDVAVGPPSDQLENRSQISVNAVSIPAVFVVRAGVGCKILQISPQSGCCFPCCPAFDFNFRPRLTQLVGLTRALCAPQQKVGAHVGNGCSGSHGLDRAHPFSCTRRPAELQRFGRGAFAKRGRGAACASQG